MKNTETKVGYTFNELLFSMLKQGLKNDKKFKEDRLMLIGGLAFFDANNCML